VLQQIIDALVRRHLLWLFETAERPDGAWGRAYLTNGRCKDQVFQLDQQCYPLLELADYYAMTGDTAVVERLKGHVGALLELLLKRRAANAWLFPTSETPADDRVAMPYHLSSQIVVWRTLRALASLNAQVALTNRNLEDAAEQVRRDVYRHMVVVHAGQPLFCYLTNLQGGYRLYHDANDLPTALAPVWGFCSRNDAIWRATIAFAYSEANVGGYYTGHYPGLGSVHTPHPWPLGAVQALLVAGLLDDAPAGARAWHTLHDRACWDGMLSEAYDEATGTVASRHWFAWPGAALAMLALAGEHEHHA
jgi:meiotically up-regulated gene 157 (Mug157) protein